MTDLERWKEFLSSFGIEFDEIVRDGITYLEMNPLKHSYVGGYVDYTTVAEFDPSGDFRQIGAWG